jgi:hypothetical protein
MMRKKSMGKRSRRRSPIYVDQPGSDEVVTAYLLHAGKMRKSEFAQLMGWTDETEASRRARGEVPAYTKVGQEVFYSFDAVTAWISDPDRFRPEAAATAAADLAGAPAPARKRGPGRPPKKRVLTPAHAPAA